MVKIFESVSQHPTEGRDHEQFSGFQGGLDNSLAEFGEVVFVCSSDLFDKAMRPKPFEHTRYLMCGFAGKVFFDSAIAKAIDVKFAPDHRFKQVQIVTVKEVEAAIAATVVADGLSNLFNVFRGRAGIVNRGDKVDIAAVCSTEQFCEHIQTVDIFLQRRKLHLACTVAMFHPAVVFKKGNVVDGCFNTQHKAVLIIHFNCHRSHVMLNPCSLYAGVKVIAHFILITAMEASSQKGSDVVGLDGMYGRPDQFVIDWSKIALSLENNVRGVFGLQDAPMIAILKKTDDRTVHAGRSVEYPVNAFGVDVIGQCLRLVKVLDAHKTVVEHCRMDAFFAQLGRHLVVAVEIELKTKWRPGGYSEVTKAKRGIDEIEVIVQAFATVVFEEGLVRIFVMPGFIAHTGLHCRKNMYQAGMLPSLGDNIFDPLFLAKVFFANEVNRKAVLGSDGFGILAYLFSQGKCPLGIVENTDVVHVQKPRHSLSIADAGDGPCQNDTVKTGSNTLDFITMSFNKIGHTRSFQYNCSKQLSGKRRAA